MVLLSIINDKNQTEAVAREETPSTTRSADHV